jgi:hypothetical protein
MLKTTVGGKTVKEITGMKPSTILDYYMRNNRIIREGKGADAKNAKQDNEAYAEALLQMKYAAKDKESGEIKINYSAIKASMSGAKPAKKAAAKKAAPVAKKAPAKKAEKPVKKAKSKKEHEAASAEAAAV